MELKPKFSFEEFSLFLNGLSISFDLNKKEIYEVYVSAREYIEDLKTSNFLITIEGINDAKLIQYVLGEYIYSYIENKEKGYSEDQLAQFASFAADKYVSLTKFSMKEKPMVNCYLPSISTLQLYITFMLQILKSYKKGEPSISLLADLLNKSISIMSSIIELLLNGEESEAFSTWRTLHECECALEVLANNSETAIPSYLKHLRYGLSFKGLAGDKETTDKIFEQIKEEMKTHNLKSKDMKKFIEYGWLYNVEGFNETDFKLNFRDGLEKMAHLDNYSEIYEMSSELIHVTPLLIYSNEQYFFYLSLLNVYESFFRLEKIFSTMFEANVSKEIFEGYLQMKRVYYLELMNIHEKEKKNFQLWKLMMDKKRD